MLNGMGRTAAAAKEMYPDAEVVSRLAFPGVLNFAVVIDGETVDAYTLCDFIFYSNI